MLKTYKYWFILGAAILYSLGVWHVASRYSSATWQKEKLEMTEKALKDNQDNTKLIAEATKGLEEKLTNLRVTQTTVHQKVIRETIKEPIYTQCVTTDGGVRDIESAISAGH